MSVETEIKLILDEQDLSQAKALLRKLGGAKFIGEQLLVNQYFDTDQFQLRCWHMGLRIRQIGNTKEQTIKTAGTVANGLHQRPEFNVDIPFEIAVPDLSLFPQTIWPETVELEKLQHQLQVLFETNFVRNKWQVVVGNSEVEVALDVGEIIANDKQAKICEIELELVSGNDTDLLALSHHLTEQMSVTMGNESKAQRGYQLL